LSWICFMMYLLANSYLYGLYNHPRLRVIAPAVIAGCRAQLHAVKQLTSI
jgi:hypothetical protein